MSETTSVYLLTGFLGAGKTTFLNRIIKQFPKDRKLTLLVNEFGEVGVDGTLVEGDDIDTIEISKGSIFCVCVKTDFIKGLYELDQKVKPDVLLIESTGVANPSDLKRDLKLPIFHDRFDFQEQFCLVDAAHFLDAYDVYASIEKQIASSTFFIINKTDLADRETIDKIKALIREYHPDPEFVETTYADIPLERFFPVAAPAGILADTPPPEPLSEEQLDQFIEDLLDSPDLQITPPDLLVSAAYRWSGSQLNQVAAMAEKLPQDLVRAKGFVAENGNLYLFSYVMGDWSIQPADVEKKRVQHLNTIVFIGPPETMDGVAAAADDNWTGLGVFQPGVGN